MHANCGATGAKHCGWLSGSRTLTGLLCLLSVIGCSRCVRAEGDIVYAAEYFRMSGKYYRFSPSDKPEETLASNGACHLYRINPDGTGRKQLTYGDLDGEDYDPKWSPDGKSILFTRIERGHHRHLICVVGQNGGAVRRLATLGDQESTGRYGWSPDGRWVIVCTYAYSEEDSCVHVIDVKTGRDRKLSPATNFAWSPNSRRVLLCSSDDREAKCRIWSWVDGRAKALRTSVWYPVWLDNRTIVGGKSPSSHVMRIITSEGNEVRRINLNCMPELKREDTFFFVWGRREMYRVPQSKTRLITETLHTMTDGGYVSCHLVDIRAGTYRPLYEGRLVGISPDGARIAAAAHEWVGPYKRGGRKVGALTIVSLKTGRKTAITGPLVDVAGGDWRVSR